MRPLMLNSQAPFPAASSTPSSAPSPAPVAYQIQNLFTPPEHHGFRPSAINDRGDIIGNVVRPPRFEEGSWVASGIHRPAGNTAELGGHQAQDGWPYGTLSSAGHIAGTHGTPASARRAWASHLGDFGEQYWPGSVSIAQGVNADGIVVGKTLLPVEPLLISRAFIIGANGRPRFLNAPEGGMTDAVAINDAGTIIVNVRSLALHDSSHRAWTWQNDTWEPLETPADCSSFANAIAPDGTVAGIVRTAGGLECAALWVDAKLIDLGLPFEMAFRPTGLRDAHLVVGQARMPDGRLAAARRTSDFGVQFLQDLLSPQLTIHLTSAISVNAAGHVLCVSDHGSQSAGFHLIPLE